MSILQTRLDLISRSAFPALGALAVCILSSSANAQQRNTPNSNSQCAIYGSGFVAVQGTGTCVQIGGRVRLDLNANSSIGHAYAPGGLNQAPAPAPFGAASAPSNGMNPAHMRLDNAAPRGRR